MITSQSLGSPVAIKLNLLLVVSLVLVAFFYATTLTIVTSALALTAIAIAIAVHKRLRLGYFACAAVCFGLFWLARTNQGFVGDKSVVMALSLPVMVLALYLHEQFVPKGSDDEHAE